ncbi:hypothetical protein B0H17DRAFT_1137236 [Mycena rosella]|uniref:Uncharacterized protein n=1 Tax=Mycena rosella TaxID=1033263 RepID=A0AAD7D942_MYCRO|nr:hypothetical protein B0H17DRAFT_1137236 [Mycena rosella]
MLVCVVDIYRPSTAQKGLRLLCSTKNCQPGFPLGYDTQLFRGLLGHLNALSTQQVRKLPLRLLKMVPRHLLQLSVVVAALLIAAPLPTVTAAPVIDFGYAQYQGVVNTSTNVMESVLEVQTEVHPPDPAAIGRTYFRPV